jgi:DNA-binding MarR family transcriptional regulator
MTLKFDPIEEARLNWERRGDRQPVPGMTSIMRAQQIMLSEVNVVLRPFRLNFTCYELLMLLTFTRRGSLPLGKIGERLQVHPASVTATVDRLERDGLVQRVAHETDRRTVLAAIMPKGRTVAQRATTALRQADLSIRALSPLEIKELTDLIRTIRLRAGDFTADGSAEDDAAGAERASRNGRAAKPARPRRTART